MTVREDRAERVPGAPRRLEVPYAWLFTRSRRVPGAVAVRGLYLGRPHCGVEKWYLVGLGLRNLFIDRMSTKLKGDVAEQAVSLKALELGWEVLRPLGDRLPYDLVLDVGGSLVKIQVKAAFLEAKSGKTVVDTRRTKTNRRVMVRARYTAADFRLRRLLPRRPSGLLRLPHLGIHELRQRNQSGRGCGSPTCGTRSAVPGGVATDCGLGTPAGNCRMVTCQIRGSLSTSRWW